MISIKLDAQGEYNVRWPRSATAILQLGQTYTQYENSLPAAEQLAAPPLAMVETAYQAARAAQTAAGDGEAIRAMASETFRQTMTVVKARLEVALVRLKSNYLSNLAQLEQWGLDTVLSSRGISVRKPKNDNAWVAFLDAYVTKESSLPVAEQITDPALAEMSTLRDTLLTAQAQRTAGRNQREANVQTRTVELQRLYDLLQAAALILAVTQFNSVVTNDLQHWGYTVTAVAPPPRSEVEAVASG